MIHLLCSCAALLGALGPQAPALRVERYQLVSEKRLSSRVTELTYRATLVNSGAAKVQVRGTPTTTSRSVEVSIGAVDFGTVAAGARAKSRGTFRVLLRPSEDEPFDVKTLEWTFVSDAGLVGGPFDLATRWIKRYSDFSISPPRLSGPEKPDALSRTEFTVSFSADATVEDVNRVLRDCRGRIAHLSAAPPMVAMVVHDPGSAVAFEGLMKEIRAKPKVVRVDLAVWEPGGSPRFVVTVRPPSAGVYIQTSAPPRPPARPAGATERGGD